MLSRLAKAIKRGFRGFGKRGYTLLEVAAVVAVTGTLAAVAMPVVSDKIAAGKVLGAQQDVQAIRDAVICFMKDTGVPPFYSTAAKVVSLPKESAVECYVICTDDGKDPTFTGTDWSIAGSSAKQASLDSQLITNTPLYPTSGDSGWKGPYLPSVKRDPWGNKYFVTVKWFAEDGDNTPQQKAVYVISAGPNGIIETSFTQPVKDLKSNAPTTGGLAFTVLGDDIISRIQ